MDDTTDQQGALLPALQHQTPSGMPWSEGLGKLLLQEAREEGGRSETSSGAIRLIAINPKLRAEAERLLPMLEEMKRPAERDEILLVIGREMPAWGISMKAAATMGVTFASYAEALEGFSLYAVEEAVVRWNAGAKGRLELKDAGFPPRPAQLAVLAQEVRREVYMAKYRAEKAMAYVEEVVDRGPPVDGDTFRKLLADLGGAKKPNPLEDTRPRLTPQQVADQLRASAAPKSQDVGDVI